jgi:hypothetical protein
MNGLFVTADCIIGLVVELAIPALAWALVIAGLIWIIQDTTLEQRVVRAEDNGHAGPGQVCCGLLVCDPTLMKGELSCMPEK